MKKLLLSLLSIFICSLFLFSPVSAYNYENAGLRPIYYIALSNTAGGYSSSTPAIAYSAAVNAPASSSGAVLNNIHIYTPSNQGFPASSVANFSIRMLVPGYSNNFEFSGFGAFSNGSLLDQQCVTNATYGDNLIADMTCTLWVFFPNYTEHTIITSNIRYRAAGLNVTVTGAGVLTVSDSGGDGISEQDLAEQIDRLTRLIPQQVDRLVTPEDLAEQIDRLTRIIPAQQDRTVQELQTQTAQIEQGNQEAQDRWEADKEEESQREEDLTDQSGDVSISAQNPGNPFASLFTTQDCQSLPTISSWFNMDSPMQVCSPYPSQIKPIIQFVSSAIVIGLLIRLYFKLFKGGYSS